MQRCCDRLAGLVTWRNTSGTTFTAARTPLVAGSIADDEDNADDFRPPPRPVRRMAVASGRGMQAAESARLDRVDGLVTSRATVPGNAGLALTYRHGGDTVTPAPRPSGL